MVGVGQRTATAMMASIHVGSSFYTNSLSPQRNGGPGRVFRMVLTAPVSPLSRRYAKKAFVAPWM